MPFASRPTICTNDSPASQTCNKTRKDATTLAPYSLNMDHTGKLYTPQEKYEESHIMEKALDLDVPNNDKEHRTSKKHPHPFRSNKSYQFNQQRDRMRNGTSSIRK